MSAADLISKLRGSLSMRTAVALAAGAAAALAFLEIAEEVLEGEATPFDHSVSLWLHDFDSPTLDGVMRAFTFLGSGAVVIGVVALVATWGLQHRRRAVVGVLVAVAAVAEGLNVLLKLFFHRSRPDLILEIVAPESYSFPSGHAMLSTAVYGMTTLIVAQLQPRFRLPLYIGTPFLILFIGISRVYLGVHWPTDVLAGFAAGGLVLIAGKLALGRLHPPTSAGAS